MDKMTSVIREPKTPEEWLNSFGPYTWNCLLSDIIVSLGFGGRQLPRHKIAEMVMEIAEAEGLGERVPQEIRNMLVPEKELTDEFESYLHRLGYDN